MRPTRRQLLIALGGVGATLGAVGAGSAVLVHRWYDRERGQGYTNLSLEEAAVLRAFAGAIWPITAHTEISGEDANLDHFFDEIIGVWPETTRDMMRVLINALDDLSALEAGAGLPALDPLARTALLMGWHDSEIPELRSAVQSLVVLLGQGWSTHPDLKGPVRGLYKCGYGR